MKCPTEKMSPVGEARIALTADGHAPAFSHTFKTISHIHIQDHRSQVVLGGDEGEGTRHSDGAARPHGHLATLQAALNSADMHSARDVADVK